jgi:hypothetical protein
MRLSDDGGIKMSQNMSLNSLQCKRLVLVVYDTKNGDLSTVYKIKAKDYVCENFCDTCHQEFNMGEKCKKSEFRWYFSQEKQTCNQFIYSGCGGNGNNFKSYEECNYSCLAQSLNMSRRQVLNSNNTLSGENITILPTTFRPRFDQQQNKTQVTNDTIVHEFNQEELITKSSIPHSSQVLKQTYNQTINSSDIIQNSTTTTTTVDDPTTTTTTTTTTTSTTATTTTETTTTTTESNNVSIDNPNKVKFDITNFAPVDTNTTDTKSYSLRLHIQGFKWNERYNDVNSSESLDFLQAEIIPLLTQRLNLSVEDLHDIRLIKLFKGSVQSDLQIQTNSNVTLNDNFIVIQNETTPMGFSSSSLKSDFADFVRTMNKSISQKYGFSNDFDLSVVKGYDLKSYCSHRELLNWVFFVLIVQEIGTKNYFCLRLNTLYLNSMKS